MIYYEKIIGFYAAAAPRGLEKEKKEKKVAEFTL